MAMTDSSLYEVENSRTLFNLPLTGDGVFGSSLEKALKDKKEQQKAVQELLPVLYNRKRRSNYIPEASSAKRSNTFQSRQGNTLNSEHIFRAPATPRGRTHNRGQSYSFRRGRRDYQEGRKP
ncbi:hypothetical protein SNE40_012302 [Patella caerulea]|uniref:Uncharacterized protein n=1 Tax=Patella caerulea TaxID=87958 RepID=A0AAN8Q0K8_PATCE